MRLEPAHFEALYAEQPDPWGFATSPYEAEKYARTLAALPAGRRFGRALECGCSIGVFTERLAPRCDELVAIDAAPTAVAAARERLAGTATDHVRVERRVLPEELPSGPFDLLVCSELLYYFGAPELVTLLDRLEAAVAPGGCLLAVHWRHPTSTYPLRGDEVHALLRGRAALTLGHEHTTEDYRLERFDRRDGAA